MYAGSFMYHLDEGPLVACGYVVCQIHCVA